MIKHIVCFKLANPTEELLKKTKDISLSKDDIVLSTELEHHSSVLPWLHASKKQGFKLEFIPLDENNRITLENFKKSIKKETKILAITMVSNVLGYLTDVKPIIEEAHKNGIIVILDGAQAVQHYPVDVKKLDCDFFAFSGHKMFGPTGVGVLYGKKQYLADGRNDIDNEKYSTNSDLFSVGKVISNLKWNDGKSLGITITVKSISSEKATIVIE